MIFFGFRVFQIETIPLFIDESINIQRSVQITNGTFLQHATTGKFLLPYYSLFFQPQYGDEDVTRLSIMILGCVGVAVAYYIARRYSGTIGGWLTIGLMTFSPMLFFFDRFALTDTLLHITVTVWVGSLVVLYDRRQPDIRYALVAGILFFIAFLVKASAIFLLPLPLIFMMLMTRWRWVDRIKITGILYATMLGLMTGFLGVLSTQNINYFDKSEHIAPSASTLFNVDRLTENVMLMTDGLITYHGIVLLGVIVVTGLIALKTHYRILLALGAGVIGYAVAIIWLGGYGIFLRYYMPVLPLLFIIAGIAGYNLTTVFRRHGKRVIVVGYGLWIVGVALPFIITLYTNPTKAQLTDADYNEYLSNNSSGYTIRAMADYIDETFGDIPTTIEGVIVGCPTLQLYLSGSDNIRVDCPNILAGDRREVFLNDYLPTQARRYSSYYVVFETRGIVNRTSIDTLDLEAVRSYQRPNGGRLTLYSTD